MKGALVRAVERRSTEREALAVAINDLDGAERDRVAAVAALEKANEHAIEARGRLEKLRPSEDDDEGSSAPTVDIAEAFAASLTAGSPMDDADLAGLAGADTAAITKAEEQLKLWRQTRDACRERLKELENRNRSLKEKRDTAAWAVIHASSARDLIAVRIDRLAAELATERSVLAFLLEGFRCCGHNPETVKQRRVYERRLANDWSTDQTKCPALSAWAAAFEALKTDPDAPLPQV